MWLRSVFMSVPIKSSRRLLGVGTPAIVDVGADVEPGAHKERARGAGRARGARGAGGARRAAARVGVDGVVRGVGPAPRARGRRRRRRPGPRAAHRRLLQRRQPAQHAPPHERALRHRYGEGFCPTSNLFSPNKPRKIFQILIEYSKRRKKRKQWMKPIKIIRYVSCCLVDEPLKNVC